LLQSLFRVVLLLLLLLLPPPLLLPSPPTAWCSPRAKQACRNPNVNPQLTAALSRLQHMPHDAAAHFATGSDIARVAGQS
jgi:hypothetical protein